MQADSLETPSKLPTEAALDLLEQCRNDLREFDNSGAFEEPDLTHVVERMRKIAAVLVTQTRLPSILGRIDGALIIPAEERKTEKQLSGIFPGPFLANRARRLIRVTEGLRDDVALRRLGCTIPEPEQTDAGAEPPPLAKWMMWFWANRRRRMGLVILTLLVGAGWYLLSSYPSLLSAFG